MEASLKPVKLTALTVTAIAPQALCPQRVLSGSPVFNEQDPSKEHWAAAAQHAPELPSGHFPQNS